MIRAVLHLLSTIIGKPAPKGIVGQGTQDYQSKKAKTTVLAFSDFESVPQDFAQSVYCSIVNVWQVAASFTGRTPEAPGRNLITPSSVEQKSRTPLTLNVTGAAADTNDLFAPPMGTNPVARNR